MERKNLCFSVNTNFGITLFLKKCGHPKGIGLRVLNNSHLLIFEIGHPVDYGTQKILRILTRRIFGNDFPSILNNLLFAQIKKNE